MFGALNRLLVAALAVGVALAVTPSVAFACGGSNPSAVNVYVECFQGGGGGKPTSGPPTTGPRGGSSTTTPSTGSAGSGSTPADKDHRVLAALVQGSGKPLLPRGNSDGGTAPSALGSAFDLGSGPTALIAVLAGTALLLLGGNGLRIWRNRHHA